jgi:ferric-dicitrate binding protein FerR (iron transport regulator)
MEPYSNRLKLLIRKFLANQCTAKELEELFSLINKFPDDPFLHQTLDADAAKETISGSKLTPQLSAVLKAGIQKGISQNGKTRPISSFQKLDYRLFKVAAVLIPVIISVTCLYFRLDRRNEVIIQTSYGEVKTIDLPDSSRVILNGNSTLRYAANWNNDEDREVVLEGEGFFNVVHQVNHKKFLVHTSNKINIEVLGTEFNVNDRKDRIQIVLQSGQIRLDLDQKNPDKEILMRSGEYVEVSCRGKIMRKLIDTQPYTAWQKSKLVFKETPLRDILLILKDNYGYKLNVRDSLLLQETFTANYPADDINVLLEALSKSFRISINATDKELLIGN